MSTSRWGNLISGTCTGPEALVPGALRGFRAWGLQMAWREKIPSTTGLYGASQDIAWTPTMTAQCLRNSCVCEDCYLRWRADFHPDHVDAPSKECQCGLYAYYVPEHLPEMTPEFGAVGVVEAFGRILMGTKGFRSQHQRIVAVAPYINPQAIPFDGEWFASRWERDVTSKLEAHGIEVWPDYHALFDAYQPEDVSNLIGNDPAA